MKLTKQIFLLLILLCSVSACVATNKAPLLPSLAADSTEYVLGSGDKLQIDVYGDETLSGDFIVDDAGKISMPLIQQIDALGQTPQALEKIIEDKLHPKYMNDPKVSVQITEYRNIFVLGEVRLPGKYPYSPNMTVMQAVAVAGGFTYRGDESDAEVMRTIKSDVRKYNFKITDKIMPGDTIYIGRRWF